MRDWPYLAQKWGSVISHFYHTANINYRLPPRLPADFLGLDALFFLGLAAILGDARLGLVIFLEAAALLGLAIFLAAFLGLDARLTTLAGLAFLVTTAALREAGTGDAAGTGEAAATGDIDLAGRLAAFLAEAFFLGEEADFFFATLGEATLPLLGETGEEDRADWGIAWAAAKEASIFLWREADNCFWRPCALNGAAIGAFFAPDFDLGLFLGLDAFFADPTFLLDIPAMDWSVI